MMLRWALGFLIVALIAAILGFGGIAVGAAGYCQDHFLYLLGFVRRLFDRASCEQDITMLRHQVDNGRLDR
jgi:uncharacterized membrane protein YtjA (UPF0391 family)